MEETNSTAAIKSSDVVKLLSEHEWVILYVKAQWCQACKLNQPVIEEVIAQTPDICIKTILADDLDNAEFLQEIGLESLPYYAVYHSKKEGADPTNPRSYFIGGETGGGKEVPEQIIGMVREFIARQAGVQ